MKRLFQITAVCLMMIPFAIFGASAQDETGGSPDEICESATPAEDPETREYAEPLDIIDPEVDYYAIFCTGVGAVYVNLFEDQTPVTVNNFVFLAENGYYNNINFHRVIQDFMAQGGDPTNSGSGGPGYQFQDEFIGYLTFDRPGLLAMANAGPATNGSQFFITTAVTSHLNYAHTIFGEVVAGQDIVESIELRDPASATTPGTTLDTVVIVTDPSIVEVEAAEPTDSATQEDFEAILEALPELPGVTVTEATGVYDTESYISTLPEAAQEDAETLLTENNHEFTMYIAHENTSCDLNTAPFSEISYTVHAFATPEDAAAALESDTLENILAMGNEFETAEGEETGDPIISYATTACDVDSTDALTYRQLGRFLVVSESVFPTDSPFTADLWLNQVVEFQVYDRIFIEQFRPEVQ